MLRGDTDFAANKVRFAVDADVVPNVRRATNDVWSIEVRGCRLEVVLNHEVVSTAPVIRVQHKRSVWCSAVRKEVALDDALMTGNLHAIGETIEVVIHDLPCELSHADIADAKNAGSGQRLEVAFFNANIESATHVADTSSAGSESAAQKARMRRVLLRGVLISGAFHSHGII